MTTALLSKVQSPLLPNDTNRPINYKREAWKKINVRYEPTAQEMADDLFQSKIKNSSDHSIEIYRIYRHQQSDGSESIVYQYNEMGTTNLNNLEMNSPDAQGLYLEPMARNTGVMNEDGILEARPTEIRRYNPKFYIPYNAESVLELSKYIGDPYQIEYIAVPAGGQTPYKCPTATHLAYMSFDQIRNCSEGLEAWPNIVKDLDKMKSEYEERIKLQTITSYYDVKTNIPESVPNPKPQVKRSADHDAAAERLKQAAKEQQ